MRALLFFLILLICCVTPVCAADFIETGPQLEIVLTRQLPVFDSGATLSVRLSAQPGTGEDGIPAWRIRQLEAIWHGVEGTVSVTASSGILRWDVARQEWNADLHDVRADLREYTPFSAISARLDLPLLSWRDWRGALQATVSTTRLNLDFDFSAHPYALQGTYQGPKNPHGSIRLAWRERRLPAIAWLPKFIDEVFKQREIRVNFRQDGLLRLDLPVEEEIRQFFYSHRQGNFTPWPRNQGYRSLNPVLRAAVTVLTHQDEVFADPDHYFLNLVNLDLPHALAVVKNLPLSAGHFRDYRDLDLDTFLEQMIFDQLGQRFMVSFENYRLRIPPATKERMEFDLYGDIRPEELESLNPEERLPLLVLIHGRLRERRLTTGDLPLRRVIRALLSDLVELGRQAGSHRVSDYHRPTMNRDFVLTLGMATLLERFAADGALPPSELAGIRLLLDQLAGRVRKNDLDDRGKRLLFALERSDCGEYLSRVREIVKKGRGTREKGSGVRD